MTPKEEQFWDSVAKHTGTVMLTGFILTLGVCTIVPRIDWSAPVTGPYVARGVFLTHTPAVNTIGGYPFLTDDGRKLYFACDRTHAGTRGRTYSTCLGFSAHRPVPDLHGRPLEVRYLIVEPTRLTGSLQEPVVLSVRDGDTVLVTNSQADDLQALATAKPKR